MYIPNLNVTGKNKRRKYFELAIVINTITKIDRKVVSDNGTKYTIDI